MAITHTYIAIRTMRKSEMEECRMKQIVRGDVIYVDLGQHPKSSVQSGMRPCVVVSNNRNNQYAKVRSVCPCTARVSKKYVPTHVRIEPEEVKGYFEKTSVLLAEQIVTVDKRKVISKTGHIPEDSKVMEKIDAAVRLQLGFAG